MALIWRSSRHWEKPAARHFAFWSGVRGRLPGRAWPDESRSTPMSTATTETFTNGSAAEYREALLRAACHLALERATVVRLAEALSGRAWEDCGPGELTTVIQYLRDMIRRAVANQTRSRSERPWDA